MIGDAIEFIRKELRDYLGVPDEEVLLNTPRKLIEDANATGVFVSLVNVQEEPALRNTSISQRIGTDHYIVMHDFINEFLAR